MKKRTSAFTLIELVVTITIVGMLMTLATPAIGRAMKKAESVKCASNLRIIGQAVHLYAQDHSNHYPTIEGMPSSPYYTADDEAGTVLEVLGPYGVEQDTLRCQSDIKQANYFAREGSSYMWRPFVDEELTTAARVYRRGREYVPPPSRLPLMSDFRPVHNGRVNCVMADGHVRMF